MATPFIVSQKHKNIYVIKYKDMAEFKHTTPLQKYQLQVLTDAVRNYVKMIELPDGCRHRKCVLVFTGDRFKATDIQVKFIRARKKR